MLDLSFITDTKQIWVALIAFILAFVGLTKLKFYENKTVLAILSLVIAIIFASSTKVVNYTFNVIPFLTVLMTVSFIITLVLVFVAKDLETFKKPLAIIGFVLAILIVLNMAFTSFPAMGHMLPSTSDSGLSHSALDFKHWIYSTDFKEGFLFVLCVSIVGFFLVKK